jgi:hypothetical protein
MEDDRIELKCGLIDLKTHFGDKTKLYMASAKATNFGLPKFKDFVSVSNPFNYMLLLRICSYNTQPAHPFLQ